jgi:hypothetical protein
MSSPAVLPRFLSYQVLSQNYHGVDRATSTQPVTPILIIRLSATPELPDIATVLSYELLPQF